MSAKLQPSVHRLRLQAVFPETQDRAAGDALELVSALRRSIQSSAESNEGYAREFADIPLVGRTIFEQQQLLYRALLEWLDHFEGQFLKE